MLLSSQRKLGLIIGLILGLGFSLTANLINQWLLPDIPFFHPGLGPVGLVILSTALFGLLGTLAAWTNEAIPSMLLSALIGSLLSSIWNIISQAAGAGGAIVLIFVVFLPRIFFYLPFAILVRWLISKFEHHGYGQTIAPARRLLPVLIWFLLVAFIGSFSRYDDETRLSLTRMKSLMDESVTATSRTELPKPLQNVEGFLSNAQGEYTFQVGTDPDILPVKRPIVEYGEIEPFIIIRYENGFRFGCVFSPPYVVPACSDF